MSVYELLRPYTRLPPLLDGDPTRQLAAATKETRAERRHADDMTHAQQQFQLMGEQYNDAIAFVSQRHEEEMLDLQDDLADKRPEIFTAGVTYGLAKGTEKANDLARENYRNGINKGYIDAFTHIIAGPNAAIVDLRQDPVKWYTGDNARAIVGTKENRSEAYRSDPARFDYFEPSYGWRSKSNMKNENTVFVPDVDDKATKFAWASHDDLLFLDIGNMRAKAQATGVLEGRVIKKNPADAKHKITGKPLTYAGEEYLVSKTASVKEIAQMLTKGDSLPTDLILTNEQINNWASTLTIGYK